MSESKPSFTERTYDRLQAICHAKGTTLEETLRDAVALEKWCEEECQRLGTRPIHVCLACGHESLTKIGKWWHLRIGRCNRK